MPVIFLDQNQNGIGGEDDDLFELTILQELPDLVVSEIECPPEALPGANIEIKWSVQNTGTGNTTHEWQDHIYLSDDNMVGDDQFVLSVDNQVVLASKEHYFRSISIPVPDKNETHHWIIIKTNANNTQDENNFTNNQSIITYPFWNTRRAYPDLYVGDIFTPNTIYVGELSTLAWQVINQGNGPTSAILWMDRVFLSQDTVLDNQDIEIATIRNPDFLASGETYYQELEMVLSSDIPENDYYVFVAADTKDQVEEFDQESNNIKMAASPVSVHVPTPGVLMVTSFIAPNQAAPGDSIQLTWTVKNIGQTTIASTNHMILLSKNIQLEPDLDAILLWTSAENYRPGQSYTLNHTVNMPSLIDMGAYYLIPATNQSMTLEKPFVSPITVTTSVFPDLVVTESMDFPERLKTDQLLTISWQVGNTGAGNTLISNWLDYLYLSKDRKADDSDIYLGKSRHDEILFANNGHTRVTKTFKLPEQLNGIYYVGIQTDALQTVNESDETNNYTFSQSPIHIQRLQTDLIVLSVHAPYSAITGQEASIEWLVQNNGVDTTASSFWVDQVYVSTDQTLDDKDILMGEITHTMTLDPGQTVKKSLTETIPSLMDGHYYVIVQVDAQNAIFESDGEQNNTYVSSEPTHVHHLFPDIQILGIKADNSEVYANESIALSYTLVNNGQTGTYGTWLDRFYLSEDNLLDLENDMIIGEITHETQIPQGTKICIHSDRLTMPARLSGAYTIFVQVDALNQMYEYGGENNNHGPCAVNIQDSPSDLQIISVNAPDSAYAGTAIHVSWEVQNKGRQDTQEAFWYDRVYLSSDNNLSPEYDIQVGNIIHKQPLKAGETYTCSHYFVIRQDLGGPYHIFVQTDAENQVYENLQENNNITQSQTDILLTGLYVDLYPSDLQFKSQQPFAGQPLDVSWQVENKGYDPTHVSSWEDIIYLSTDGIPDISDTILGVYQHNGVLNAGEFYIKTKTITIPKDIEGKYYLIIKTDANAFNDVFEDQGEDNNSICKEIHVETSPTPNLTVTELIVPNQAWSGQYLRVEWSVENNGAIDIQTETGFWYDSVYLSRDPFLDVVHDIPIGNVMYKGMLPKISGIYKQFLDTMLPPGISGPYYVIVQTDSSIPQHVYETNRMDNVRIADNIIDIQLTPPSDLIVTSISIPETGKPGELLTWQFDIKNNGDRPAVGSWYDTLYLSADKVWDTQDYRIARFYQDGDIPDKKEYTAVVPAIVPTAIPGAYYVIVRTDILDDIRETNESNNMRVSSQTIQIENTIIERNEIIKDTISSGDFKYFQLNTKQSEDIEVFLNGPAALCSQFFVGEGFIPGRSQYDHRSTLIEDQRLMLNLSELSSDNYFLSLYGHRCEKDTPFEISVNYLVSLRIHELSVSKATNIGMTTLQIKGAHFDDNIHVRLMLNDIELDRVQSVNVLNSGQISLTLDLHDLQKGKYHIVLENPDQETAQTTFEVVSDKRGELFARLLIPGYVTQNKVFRFTLEYGNIGHSDILAPLLLISAGDGGLLRKDSSDDFSDEPIQILGLSDRYPVDVLPPDSFFTVKFEFMLTTDEYVPFYIQVMDQPEAPIDWEGLQTRLRPQKIDDQMWKIIFTKFKTDMGQTWGDYVNRLRKNAVDSADYGTAIRDVYTLLPNLTNGRTNIKMALPIPPGTRRTSGGSLAPETDDGQDKLTSIGAGTLHHMLFDRTIEYTIRFENKSHASASAQYIQISDPLSEKLAIDTFELKEITLGDYQIDIPQYHSYYHTRLDLRPSGQDLIVDIEAGIDDATRMARWIFTAIDPATGEQSEDPLTGFLPPNASGHSGEGYVRFQIKPLANIESGTIISNMATIIFDRNEPVDTPIAYNTVDLNLPESRVERMASPEQLEIPVRWGGQDTMDGSGIASYDVYVSENDQPYEIWLSKTTATSGIYVGKPGHQYSFYSIATDRVGNIEAPPAQPDAVVKLKNTSPPNRPILISPDSNAMNIGSSPILKTGAFTDLDGSTHLATRWQISKTLDFELLVMDIQSQIFLTELIVPNGILSENTIYYWQAKHIDEHESASHWSQYRQFATTTFDVPVISNTDLNLDQNEMLDIHQTDIAIVEVDTIYIGVKSETSGVTVVSANAFDYTADLGLPPAEMPYGLISFRAECPKGSEVDIQLYFSENLPSNAKWYKFDFHNGFSDYSAHTQSNLPGHQITITVKDGGYGDADGLENGVIVDPGGIGIFSENVLLDNDDSSGSCFLELIQF
ncbi:MAG: hypothetical protein OMM_07123 [Candidatus Magnetoglobus multicellularis str. Araruama]|uniref:Uncharacterized protein n=1 Tax=Candidatus Magnetoglobus multicellularis str. Araruama TaxID=890399 RepID=A0A1V1PE12_9BACT|nr:MAG: hypothetical protein OMM_07123 [Candidatus Magnetoglobus multicellularis str. Araruama]